MVIKSLVSCHPVNESCAIKLTTHLAALTALRRMAAAGEEVQGGQPLVNPAKAEGILHHEERARWNTWPPTAWPADSKESA